MQFKQKVDSSLGRKVKWPIVNVESVEKEEEIQMMEVKVS